MSTSSDPELLSLQYRVEELERALAHAHATQPPAHPSTDFLLHVLNSTPDPIFVKDQQHRWVLCNQAFCDLVGYRATQLLGKSDPDFFPREQARVFREQDDRVFATGQVVSEDLLTDASGTVRVISTQKTCFQDATGSRFLVGTIQDITDRTTAEVAMQRTYEDLAVQVQESTAELKCTIAQLQQEVDSRQQAQAELQRTRKFLQSVVDNMPVAVFVKDLDLRYRVWNTAAESMTGYSAAEAIGKTTYDLYSPAQAEWLTQRDRAVLSSGQTIEVSEEMLENRWGDSCLMHIKKTPILDQTGTPRYLLAIHEDITDRKQAEIQLRQQAHELQTALQDLQRTQSQLIQSAKMSSLGQLVAGVAHEINNPVNFIYGNLNYASHYMHDLLKLIQQYQTHYPNPIAEIAAEIEAIDLNFIQQDLPRLLTSIRVGAERIQKIVLSLRTFSRMDEAEFKTVDIHDGIDSTLMILQHRLKAKPGRIGEPPRPDIQVVKTYASLPKVECYAGQMNQVFMNILANAIDALEVGAVEAPRIQITTELETNQVVICIADNGPGMTETVRQRLFDPFFTTKEVGKGTGMGLSISYQVVVDRHGGSLHCQSAPNQGCEFVLRIPLRQEGRSHGNLK